MSEQNPIKFDLKGDFEALVPPKRPTSRPASAAKTPPAAEAAPPAPTETAPPVAPAPHKQTKKAAKPASEAMADQQLVKRCTVFVTKSLHDDVAIWCARHGRTRTELLLAALNATHARLPELVARDQQAQAPALAEGDLFAVSLQPQEKNTSQIPIYPTVAQLEVIDALPERCGARDRSHLASVALREFLRTALDDLS